MADQGNAVKPLGVEQAEQVAGERRLGVVAGRRVGPAEAAQVGREHAMGAGQRRDHAPPAPPVLRPAVDEHERRTRAGLGDMQAHSGAHVDVAMAHAAQHPQIELAHPPRSAPDGQ